MSVLVVRHGLSEANDREKPGFGRADASLMPFGMVHARDARDILVATYGIDPWTSVAATSEMLRSQQTARAAGFITIKSYAVLDEVHVPKTPELRAILDRGELVPEARQAAEHVLADPPAEKVWFTHGYLIAALCEMTRIDTSELRFIPRFGEVRELPIR